MSEHENHETRQERRARKLKAKRARIQQHGAGLRRGFSDAALKMARKYVRRQSRRGR